MSKEIIEINISGMTCVNCSNGIEKAVNKLDGLLSSKVHGTVNGKFYRKSTVLADTKLNLAWAKNKTQLNILNK